MGLSVIIRPPLLRTGIDDADRSLGFRMDVEVMDLDRLLVAPSVPVESLDQIQM